jgi:hypothetical protein
MLLPLQQNLLLSGASAPIFTGTIPDIFQRKDTGNYTYDLSVYFSGATSYAIAPAIDTGWTFDTNTAVLVIDTDAVGAFGPFTVTATNATGSTPSNAFNVEVAAKNTGAGRTKKRRRLFVEIDGQDFEVGSAEEAIQLLNQAKQVAVAQIERAAAIRISSGIPRPKITSKSPELKQVVSKARKEITSLYDQAIRDFEIAALMAAAEQEDEEEALIRFLM